MILVTGAAGKTGRAVLRALVGQEANVRVLVRRQVQARELESIGAREALVGDMLDEATVHAATSGVDSVYHIAPNMHPEEVRMGELALRGAEKAGVEHFVYHSVLKPQTEDMPHHWNKLRVEERILKSGLSSTVLQPAAYMQNLLGYRDQILDEGIYKVPYAVDTQISLVDLRDVGEVAAAVLTDPSSHRGASYELCGTGPLDQGEIARVIGEALGRTVTARSMPRNAWAQEAHIGGNLEEQAIDWLLAMFRYYESFGFPGNPNVLRWLLNRAPTGLSSFVRREMAEET